MVLTLAQVIEAFFIAVVLVLVTSPHLLHAVQAGNLGFNLLQLF